MKILGTDYSPRFRTFKNTSKGDVMTRKGFNLIIVVAFCLFSIPLFSAENSAPIKIACVGDSITYGAKIKNKKKMSYPAQLQAMLGNGFEVTNFGISSRTLLKKGDEPYWKEQIYSDALKFEPDYVIIKLGTNDIKPNNWKHKEEFADDLKALVESFQKLSSKPVVFVSYPVPVQKSRWKMTEQNIVNGVMPQVDQVAKEMNLSIIDFHKAVPAKPELFVDGIHPNASGAKLMAEAVHAMLKAKGVLSDSDIKAKPFNSALMPRPKLERDFYDWDKRHKEVKALIKKQKVDLVFIGDSITHMFGGLPKSRRKRGSRIWNKYYGHRNVVNMGFGWDRTQNVLWRLDNGEFEGITPKVAVVMIGTNNLTGTKNAVKNTPAEIAEGIVAICKTIHKKVPGCKILLLGVLPRSPNHFVNPIKEINKHIAPLDKEDYITFLNMYDQFADKDGLPKQELMRDSVHPNTTGYSVWAKTMEPVLSKLLNDKAVMPNKANVGDGK